MNAQRVRFMCTAFQSRTTRPVSLTSSHAKQSHKLWVTHVANIHKVDTSDETQAISVSGSLESRTTFKLSKLGQEPPSVKSQQGLIHSKSVTTCTVLAEQVQPRRVLSCCVRKRQHASTKHPASTILCMSNSTSYDIKRFRLS